MKTLTLSTLFVLLFSFSVLAQNDRILIIPSAGGVRFEQNGIPQSTKSLLSIMESNPEAHEYMTKAHANNSLGNVLSYAGGAFIGYPIGTYLGGGEPNWVLAGVGAGILLIAFPVMSSAKENAIKAVEIYNSGLLSYRGKYPVNYKIGFTSSGFGFQMTF